MRELATIRTIAEIRPHTNADALELAIIDGWQVVVLKGQFQAGQAIVFLEIDSWVPHELAPFLSKGKEPREFECVKGERLRTIKLRGELSQGLVLSLDVVCINGLVASAFQNGDDVTVMLGIKKWERPMSPQLAGQARGNFPSFIRKTDQERIQNIFKKLGVREAIDLYEVTLKLDGSSTTFYVKDDHVGVCSRNLELKTDEENAHNMFVKMFYQLGMDWRLRAYRTATGRNIAVQGELWGAGINGNWEGISDVRFNAFDIFDIDRQAYLDAHERAGILEMLEVPAVPVIGDALMSIINMQSVEDFLKFADRPSLYNPVAEGVVFKSINNPDFSFKAINNKYLLGGGE